VAQLLELARLTWQHPAIGTLPAIERLLGDPDLAADVAHGHAPRDLLQDRRNLLDGKALSLHGMPSWPVGRIVPRNSPSAWTEKPGAPHRLFLWRLPSAIAMAGGLGGPKTLVNSADDPLSSVTIEKVLYPVIFAQNRVFHQSNVR